MTRAKPIEVSCHSGYRADEYPVRFVLDGHFIQVVEVLNRWRSPEFRYFKVRGEDERVYLLRQEPCRDTWDLPELMG